MQSPDATNSTDNSRKQEARAHGADVSVSKDVALIEGARMPSSPYAKRDYDYEQTLDGHTAPIRAVTMMSDGRIVTGGDDTTLLVWRRTTKPEYDRLWQEVREQYERALPPNTCTLFGVHRDALDALRKARMIQGELRGHTQPITCVASMRDGRVISGSEDGALRIWSARGGELSWGSHVLEGHAGGIACVQILDEHTVVSGSKDGTVRVWSEASGEWSCETLLGHTGSVCAIDLFPNGDILSGGTDQTARVWRRSATGWATDLVVHGGDEFRSVKVLSHSEFVGVGSKSAHMWRLDTETGRWSWHKREGLQGAHLLRDGSVVAFTGDPGVIVWRCAEQDGWREVAFRKDWRNMVALTPLSCGGILMRTHWMDEGWMRRDVEVLRVDQEDNLTGDVRFTQKAAYNEVRDLSLPDGRFGIVCKDGSIQIYRGAPIRGS